MKLIPYLIFILIYYFVRLLALSGNGHFFVSFLNVGQGDSAVINIPKYGQIMVDTGPDYQSNYLSAELTVLPTCRIKAVFVTHYDQDHSGGLDRVLKYCNDIKIYDNLSKGDVIKIGEVAFSVLSPPTKNSAHQENDDSIVLLVRHRDFSALLTGDAGLGVLSAVSNKIDMGLDVYKVSHHGSKYNTGRSLINRLRPANCVISVGKNSYGHPSKAVIGDLLTTGCKVYRTDVDGTITFR